jgi:hypothetical protein
MEHAIEDAVIKFGAAWPVIGAAWAVMILCGFTAWKVKDDYQVGAVILVVIGLFFGISIMNDASKAEAACMTLYSSSPSEYDQRNCDVLVHCTTRLFDKCD